MKTRLVHVRANVRNLERAIQWYREYLGFEVDGVWPSDNPIYASFISQEGAVFAIGVAATVPSGARFNFSIDDVDAFWETLKDKVVVVEQLYDTPYGTRKFIIRDVDGNEMVFSKG